MAFGFAAEKLCGVSFRWSDGLLGDRRKRYHRRWRRLYRHRIRRGQNSFDISGFGSYFHPPCRRRLGSLIFSHH